MVSAVNNSINTASSGNGSAAADLSDSFMQLLVAQMQNQDPTNPMDNNQLTSQLAQFNTAAGIEKLNTAAQNMQQTMISLGSMNAASWVGRSVLMEGDPKVTVGRNNEILPIADTNATPESQDFNFYLKNDADTVTVTLTDAEGNAYTADLKNVKAGTKKFSLDDLKEFKPAEPAPDTEYTVTFSAKKGEDTVDVTGLTAETVAGVTLTDAGPYLHLVGRDDMVTLADIFVIQ
ncbi:flagellar hook assembly protein FlgD [Pantoea sp. NPDC088449]|uniref:flagellar hook assembly protein FlgD n=1 Tax=Pantoea sp. NPDC088449 TaxID=3364392 RepID=UPI0038030751